MIRLYAALLRLLLPPGFRARYGDEMEAFHAEGRRDLAGWARLRFSVRALVDLVPTALHARREERQAGEPTAPGWMAEALADARHGARALRRRPGFAFAAVLTVGLGVGAATTVFTVVDGVVLRPLPYDDPRELVSLWTTFDNVGETPFGVSLAVQHDYLEETRVFETLGGFSAGEATLTGLGEPRRVPTANLWEDVFGTTGIGVQQGRLPLPEELVSGAAPVALVTQEFWRGPLQADPEVVGRTLELDGRTVEILGVLEEGAWLPEAENARIWLPVQRSRSDIVDRSGHSMFVLARLAPGRTLEDARRERDAVQERWRERWAGHHSPGHPGHDIRMERAHTWYFGDLRPLGGLLLGAAGLLLALACANVASLLLARGESRRGELAVRRALGAARGRIVRALLAENAVVAGAGGVVGFFLAWLGTDLLLGVAPDGLKRMGVVGVDLRVAGFTLGASAASGLLFGAIPALRTSWSAPRGDRGRTGPGRGLSRTLHLLVAGQTALSVILLSGAALLGRSVVEMLSVDPGLEAEGRTVATLSIPASRYPDMEDAEAFWNRILRGARAIPGVEAAAFTRALPLLDELRNEGMVLPGSAARAEDVMPVADQVVTAGYFAAAGIPVVAGRGFLDTDIRSAPNVAVINETAARRHFPGASPLGRTVQPLWVTPDHGPVEIVGVVGDVLHEGARDGVFPELYVPLAQAAVNEARWLRGGSLVLRTRGGMAGLPGLLRQVVADVDPQVPVDEVRAWPAVVRGSVAPERFVATVVGSFSVLALLLAALGTYGVMAFTSARRVREVGVRLALGAERPRVVRELVLRLGTATGMGLAVGLAGAVVGAPLLGSFVFGVEPRDPVTLLAAPVLMGAVALAAAVLPAVRAGRTDPVVALRAEE